MRNAESPAEFAADVANASTDACLHLSQLQQEAILIGVMCKESVVVAPVHLVCYKETRWLGLLQRDAIVGHAEAIRTQSRKPSKAHTHKKRQPTNAGQPHSTRRKPSKAHTYLTRTPHTHHTAPCATKAPATGTTVRHPPRARQGPA